MIRFCDLVMKGGITSGLVYPRAIVELAKEYRFKNIGGTSAGAIAAAAVAAAALGERRLELGTSRARAQAQGMMGLEGVADQLAREGFIFSLFQPCGAGSAGYRALVRFAAAKSFLSRTAALMAGVWSLGWLMFLLTFGFLFLFGWGVGGWRGSAGAFFPALVCAGLAGAARAAFRTTDAISGNLMGLCSGLREPGNEGDALTEWMHESTRALAGSDPRLERPVTFGDLWKAPKYPKEPATTESIQLHIITTNLSHAEPRTLPFGQRGFYFLEGEFQRLFPPAVVEWLKQHALSTCRGGGQEYIELPAPEDLPIVVAARMSLSFPLLISAVPLYERDFSSEVALPRPVAEPTARRRERPRLAETTDALAASADQLFQARDGGQDVRMRRCWFSDGGISSNFPLHLFDSPLPRWPTFALDLVYAEPGQPAQPVFLPANNGQGLWPRHVAIGGKGGFSDIAAFLGAIISTMQNWRDLLQGRAPGHRDRIVRVGLTSDEGGMNLNMSQETLESIASKGEEAGKKIVEEFDFDNHFWVRYRNAASGLERFTLGFAEGLELPLSPYNRAAYDRMWSDKGSRAGPYRFTKAQASEAVSRLKEIKANAEVWRDAPMDLTQGAPKPLPTLKLTPIY